MSQSGNAMGLSDVVLPWVQAGRTYGLNGSVNGPPVPTVPDTVSQGFLVTGPHPASASPLMIGPGGPVLKVRDPFDSTSPLTVIAPCPLIVTPPPQPPPSARIGG